MSDGSERGATGSWRDVPPCESEGGRGRHNDRDPERGQETGDQDRRGKGIRRLGVDVVGMVMRVIVGVEDGAAVRDGGEEVLFLVVVMIMVMRRNVGAPGVDVVVIVAVMMMGEHHRPRRDCAGEIQPQDDRGQAMPKSIHERSY